MPIPQKQLKQLKVDTKNHEKELKELKAGGQAHQPDVRTQIELHETILKVVKDPKILKALEELHDKPELAGQLVGNPKAFTEARGIQLPSYATKIVVLRQAPKPVRVGIDFHLEHIDFRLEWSAEHGFSISQLPDSRSGTFDWDAVRNVASPNPAAP